MTKTAFLAAYRAALVAGYPWAADTARLDRFMASVTATVTTKANTWNCDGSGEALLTAWHNIGGSGKVSLKKLRALAM